jgi:hypothetical protein
MSADAICTVCGKAIAANANEEHPVCSHCQAAAVSDQPMPRTDPGLTAIQEERLRAIYPPELDSALLQSDQNDRNATGNPGIVNAALFIALAFVALVIFLGFVCALK